MAIYPSSDENILKAASTINAGGLVAFPTETVYGLGADAFNPMAVSKIFEVKNRPSFDPLIVHVSDMEQVESLVESSNDETKQLMEKFWPGPLTVILKKRSEVHDIVTAGLDTVAIRMPSHPAALKLIENSKTPIAAPSANPFGYISPTRAEHVENLLGGKIDMVIDGGECAVGIESTIIKIEGDTKLLLRPGGTPLEEIEKIIGTVEIRANPDIPNSPGQLSLHYSPSITVQIVNSIDEIDYNDAKAGFLLFRPGEIDLPAERTEVLSEAGNLNEAACNLFSSLHKLDRLNLNVIYAEAVPEEALGRAIMDRLRRASKKK